MRKPLLSMISILSLILLIQISNATDYTSEHVPVNISIYEIVGETFGGGGGGFFKEIRLYDLKIECDDIVLFNTYSRCKATIENKGNVWEDILVSFQVFDPLNNMFKIIEESILVPPDTKTVKEFKTIIPSQPVPSYSIIEENRSETQYVFYPTEGKYLASISLSVQNETLATSKESFFVLSVKDILTDLEVVFVIAFIVIVIGGLGFYDYIKRDKEKSKKLRRILSR